MLPIRILAQAWDDPSVQMRLALAFGVLVAFIVIGYLVRYTLSLYARTIAAKTKTDIDDMIMAAVHPPAVLIFFTLGFWWAFRLAAQVVPVFRDYENLFFGVLVVLSAYTLGRLLSALLRYLASTRPNYQGLAGVGAKASYTVLFIVGGLLILNNYGVEITPLLASLGIGGLAVALALQPTLSNLFAGFWIQSSRTVRRGDFVRIEGIAQEGFVVDVGWRTTRLRTRSNHLVAIPNTKMADSVVSNFDQPDTREFASTEVGVSYNSKLSKVEEILLEEAATLAKEHEKVDETYVPKVRINGFGDSAVNFLIIIRTAHYTDQGAVLGELRKRVAAAFEREGIEIPFPHRTLYLRQEATEGPVRVATNGAAAKGEAASTAPGNAYEQGSA